MNESAGCWLRLQRGGIREYIREDERGEHVREDARVQEEDEGARKFVYEDFVMLYNIYSPLILQFSINLKFCM